MNRRFRSVGALLALLAFSAYFAENVWASSCPPDMDGEGTAAHAMGAAHEKGQAHGEARGQAHAVDAAHHHDAASTPQPATGMEAHASDTPDGSERDGEQPACPFAAVAGGCGSVSLAASGDLSPSTAHEVALRGATPSSVSGTLLETSLFHPPRA